MLFVSGAHGLRTFFAVEIRVFRRLHAYRQELSDAGGAGTGMLVAGGVTPIRRSVCAQAVELVPETERFGQGKTASR